MLELFVGSIATLLGQLSSTGFAAIGIEIIGASDFASTAFFNEFVSRPFIDFFEFNQVVFVLGIFFKHVHTQWGQNRLNRNRHFLIGDGFYLTRCLPPTPLKSKEGDRNRADHSTPNCIFCIGRKFKHQ